MKNIKQLSDEGLVIHVRSQDQEQYRELVVRYQEKLLRYAARLTSDNEMAKDVVQEAFIKAFINLYSFNTEKKFSSWIYRIVHNEAMNYLKKHRREVSVSSEIGGSIAANSVVEPEKIFENKEVEGLLMECLEAMPIHYRDPLILFYSEGKKYEEISEILRLPVGTVGARINRGKRRLKELYIEKGEKLYAKR